jgi:phosphatidylglycerophosphate synthase
MFEVLLVATVVVRGMGAGIIYDSAVVSPRVRHGVGLPAYADYLRANLAGLGGKSYVPVAWLGALLTITTTVAATVLAFLGTGLALPALFRVTRISPAEHDQLKSRLDRYARWYAFSALWQAVAFIAAVIALAAHS